MNFNIFSVYVLACMGVSLAEGFLMNGLFKSAARQPDIIPTIAQFDDHGDCLYRRNILCNLGDVICH